MSNVQFFGNGLSRISRALTKISCLLAQINWVMSVFLIRVIGWTIDVKDWGALILGQESQDLKNNEAKDRTWGCDAKLEWKCLFSEEKCMKSIGHGCNVQKNYDN
jgi:hypothetical protein